MKIEPKSSAHVMPLTATNQQSSARDRAIAKLVGTQSTPVQNPTNVTPEELSAITTTTSSETSAEAAQSVQSDTISEASSEAKESPKVVEEEKKKAEDPLSTQYAQLAKKEKALRAKVLAQENALKAKEAEIAAREASIKAKEDEYKSNYVPKDRLKRETLSVLSEEGISYDDITKAILNPTASQDPRIIAEIERLKLAVEQTQKSQEQARLDQQAAQKQAYNQALNQIRNDVTRLVERDESFEAIKTTKSVDDVVELIEKTFNKDGILLSVEEAAQAIEDHLVEELASYTQIKKIQSRLQANKPVSSAQKQQQTSAEPKSQQQSSGMKTLTNSVNATKKLNARERAIAAFKGELK